MFVPQDQRVLKAMGSRSFKQARSQIARALDTVALRVGEKRVGHPVRVRARRVHIARQTQTMTTVENGVTVRQTITAPDDTEVGAGATETSTPVRSGGSLAGGTMTDSTFVQKCPNAAGNVPGEHTYRLASSTVTRSSLAPGVSLVMRQESGWDATLEGHVGDDARLKDFKYSATGFDEVQAHLEHSASGTLMHHFPTQVERFTLARARIDPHHPSPSGDEIFTHGSWNARGPKGSVFTPTEREASAEFVALADQEIAQRGAKALLAAEADWYGTQDFGGMCLNAEFTPSTLDLLSGQSAGIAARVRHAFEHVEVPIRLKTEVGGPCTGTISPAAAKTAPSTPAQLTYTAGSCAQPVAKGSFSVEGTSKRGRVVGRYDNITIRRIPAAYVGTIKGSVQGTGFGGDSQSETWATSDVRFDREPGRATNYLLSAGQVNWSLSATVAGQCTETGSAVLPAVGGTWAGSIGFTDQQHSQYHAGATYQRQGPYTLKCQDHTQTGPFDVFPDWFDSNGNQGYLNTTNPDGTLTGSVDVSSGGGAGTPGGNTAHWEWNLTPVY
jgi:hypothetical protein